MRRAMTMAVLLAVGLAGVAHAQLEELFSAHVQVQNPVGPFVQWLIKVQPAGGDGWKTHSVPDAGVKLTLPAGVTADTTKSESRVFLAVLSADEKRPRPALRVDVFTPQPGETAEVDLDYAKEYAVAYPQQAFQGKFTVTDSGMVTLKKQPLAMVGGTYQAGLSATAAYRLQWSYLSKERQIFLTFDCREEEWENYADRVARILLSLELPRRKKD